MNKTNVKQLKIKYGVKCAVNVCVIIVLFLLSKQLTQRLGFFVIFLNALIVLYTAKIALRIYMYRGAKDSGPDIRDMLDALNDQCAIVHNKILTHENGHMFFQHILCCNGTMYFVNLYSKKDEEVAKKVIERNIKLSEYNFSYVCLTNEQQVKDVLMELKVIPSMDLDQDQAMLATINALSV